MAEQNKNQNRDLPKWISEGLLIAAIPTLIYYLSFGWEMGYFSYFEIPYDFISINIISIFPTIHILSISALGLIYFYVFRFNYDKIYFYLPVISLVVIYVVLSFIGFKCIGYKKIIEFVVSLAIGAASVIFVVVCKWHWMRSKLNLQYKYKFKSLIWIIALFLFIYSAFEFGRVYNFYKTQSIKNFRIYEANPEMIALRIYSDRLICAEFDRENKTVDSTFIIIDISSNSPVRLHEEEIGPLKPIKRAPEEKRADKIGD